MSLYLKARIVHDYVFNILQTPSWRASVPITFGACKVGTLRLSTMFFVRPCTKTTERLSKKTVIYLRKQWTISMNVTSCRKNYVEMLFSSICWSENVLILNERWLLYTQRLHIPGQSMILINTSYPWMLMPTIMPDNTIAVHLNYSATMWWTAVTTVATGELTIRKSFTSITMHAWSNVH